jgi:glycolate oxidase iron-sulfur subunit
MRSCVHCGFCNATCPTYQLLGDELDGPRGRIYLIKDMLESQEVEDTAVAHLDRCLTCRACETTCPSGVAYGELLEIARNYQESNRPRAWFDALRRGWMLRVIPHAVVFRRWAAIGRLAGPLLSRRLRAQLPAAGVRRSRVELAPLEAPVLRVLLLDGCVQQVSTPGVNDALESLLRARNIAVVRLAEEGCCGGLALHLGREDQALRTMAESLAALANTLDEVDAVVSTASGCGVTLKDYGRLLGATEHADLAAAFASKVRDVGEFLAELGGGWQRVPDVQRVALHIPCTLQHGQRRAEYPARLLESAGYELLEVKDSHLCCGSAGTYSILEPELSGRLGTARAAALAANDPQVIATANVGCQVHLTGFLDQPVMHWIELLQAPATAAATVEDMP